MKLLHDHKTPLRTEKRRRNQENLASSTHATGSNILMCQAVEKGLFKDLQLSSSLLSTKLFIKIHFKNCCRWLTNSTKEKLFLPEEFALGGE